MATTKITVKQSGAAFIDNYSAVDPLVSLDATSRSLTHAFIAIDATHRYEVTGTNLKYDVNHILSSGRVTQIKIQSLDGASYHTDLVASGFSLDIAKARTAYNHHEAYGLATDPVWNFDAIDTPSNSGVGVKTFYGGTHNDTIKGSAFDDDLDGHEGKDTIDGRAGNDMLGGGAGDDHVYGRSGNDTLSGSSGNDTLDGGDGRDWYMAPHSSYFTSTVKVKVDLTAGTASSSAWGNDTLIAIENAYGNFGNDTLLGSNARNVLLGSGGNDKVNGRGGDDKLLMSEGVDTLTGGNGKDEFVFAGQSGADHITDFVAGQDKLVFGWNPTGGYGVGDTLDSNEVRFGANPTNANQRLIYDKSNGHLYADLDGNGSAYSKVLLATLDNKPTLTFADFKLVHLADDYWV